MIYRHIVIIQDNQQIIRVGRRIIQPLEGESSGHSAIPDHGDHMAIQFLLQGRGYRHTHRRRDWIWGVSGDKSVILTFRRIREAANSFKLTERMENIFPSCKYFMSVSLMPDIPDNTVIGGIEYIMKGDCQLYRTKACT